MNTGAIVMLVIGAAGLWGGVVFFIANYFKAAKAEREANERNEANERESSERESSERESNDRES